MIRLEIDEELELIQLDESDAERLFELIDSGRDYLRQWLPWIDRTQSPMTLLSFIQATREQYLSGNGFQTGVWYKGSLCGVIGYHNVDRVNKCTSLGYWLGQSFQGKGIMKRACKKYIEYAFCEYGLNRVEIRCAETNYKSRAIPEGLGFTKEGIIREEEWLYDHYVSHIVYGLLAGEWQR